MVGFDLGLEDDALALRAAAIDDGTTVDGNELWAGI